MASCSCKSGKNGRSICGVTAPGRSRTGRSPASDRTVDSSPTLHAPPSTMASTLPHRSLIQCSAVVGLGEPDRFAEGAATGTPAQWIICLATGWEGMRTATVSNPPEVSSGMFSLLGRMMVSGPGENCSHSR